MNTALSINEQEIKKGHANLQRGPETVGGSLYLTTEKLVFESHALNIRTGPTCISLAQIQSITKCWTKFLNIFPLTPNSIAVQTTQGEEYRFVVFNREAWISAISGAL